MSSKSKKKQPQMSFTKAVDNALTIFVWAWVSIFSPTQEDADKMHREISNIRESIAKGNLRLNEVREQIYDEYGWEICDR